ncbi:MAG: OmpA family protein [Bacteroidota bacterium]
MTAQDVEGSEDYALLSRYPGSTIVSYFSNNFTNYPIFLDLYLKKTPKEVEGQFYSINYEGPSGKSPYELHRNYEVALEEDGFTKIWNCKNCDTWGLFEALQVSGEPAEHYRGVAGMSGDGYYSAYEKNGLFIVVMSSSYYGDASHTVLEIIETEEMNIGNVVVNADLIKTTLDKDGRIALYGILFDTGKAVLKPESKTELDAIAEYLGKYVGENLYVVGHTDMIGTFSSNLELSEARAAAVRTYLIENHQIDEGRLTPYGVGPVAPVATNETDKGKQQNRRVELVRK